MSDFSSPGQPPGNQPGQWANEPWASAWSANPAGSTPPPKRRRGRTFLGLGIVGLVVLLIGAAIGSAGASGANTSAAPAPTVTRSVSVTKTVTATATATTTRTMVRPGPTRTATRTVVRTAPAVTVTAAAPAAPQSQNAPDCTPGYSPCIPPGPDVDCAGGSGDGPRYVQGPVYVTGPDIYGLDRDGDGVGCE